MPRQQQRQRNRPRQLQLHQLRSPMRWKCQQPSILRKQDFGFGDLSAWRSRQRHVHALSTLEMQQTTSRECELVDVCIMPFSTVWALRVLCRITNSIILRCRSYHDYCLFQKELLRCIRPTTMISRSDSRRTRVLESNWSLETSSKTGYAGRKSGTQLQLEGNSPSTTSGGGEYIQIRSSKTSTPEGSLIQWFAHSGMQQRGRELVTVIR